MLDRSSKAYFQKTLLVEHFRLRQAKMFDRLATSKKYCSSNIFCLRQAKMLFNFFKNIPPQILLFLIVKQCFLTWPNGQTFVVKQNLKCLVVRQGPNTRILLRCPLDCILASYSIRESCNPCFKFMVCLTYASNPLRLGGATLVL